MITSGPYYTAPSKRRTFGALSVWAEDGLIFCEWQKKAQHNSNDAGDVEALEIPDALEWLRKMHADLEIWDKAREGAPTAKDRAYAIEYFHTLKGQMEAIRETIRDGKEQGDQSNPEIRRKKLVQFLRSRRANLGSQEGLQTLQSQASALFFPQGYERPKIFTTGKAMLFDPPPVPGK